MDTLQSSSIEVSVVMPCLNEEKTIGACIKKILQVFEQQNISGEVVVADNGSTDNSAAIAQSLGVRVVHQPVRGYGSAYLAGIAVAKGKYIVIGDSDNTYDFSHLLRFIEPLREGYDLVIGSRFKGAIKKGAMPWSHRYIGNPMLSKILNTLFHANVSDVYCGMRALTRAAYAKMQLQATGMEFALEMVIKAIKNKLNIAEVPITYHPREGESKLHPLRDAWRSLRFMMLYSPTHLFLIPGCFLFLIS